MLPIYKSFYCKVELPLAFMLIPAITARYNDDTTISALSNTQNTTNYDNKMMQAFKKLKIYLSFRDKFGASEESWASTETDVTFCVFGLIRFGFSISIK